MHGNACLNFGLPINEIKELFEKNLNPAVEKGAVLSIDLETGNETIVFPEEAKGLGHAVIGRLCEEQSSNVE